MNVLAEMARVASLSCCRLNMGAGDADLHLKTHCPVPRDFAFASTYMTHMRPLGLRGKFISRTACAIPSFYYAGVQRAHTKFSFFMNSSPWSHSHAEQKPHISRAPSSTIQTYCACARNLDAVQLGLKTLIITVRFCVSVWFPRLLIIMSPKRFASCVFF